MRDYLTDRDVQKIRTNCARLLLVIVLILLCL
jgi:hypothetical protein